MGMFDEIIYKDQVYQTKDTPDQFLTTYEIRGDELWKEHVEYDWVENVDDIFGGHLKRISSEWKFESDFDGAIRFYRMIESGEKKSWEEYRSLFMDGKMIKISQEINTFE